MGVTNVDHRYPSFELPPLPPSLSRWELTDATSPRLCTPQMTTIWESAAFSFGPCWLPNWVEAQADLPVREPSWAVGPEVIFRPGVAGIGSRPGLSEPTPWSDSTGGFADHGLQREHAQ